MTNGKINCIINIIKKLVRRLFMKCELLHLKDYYSFLGEDGKDPLLEINLRHNMAELKRENDKRPCVIVCPGGAYKRCAEREAEPISVKFLAAGFNTFTLLYSVVPHRFPSQIREVAAVMELIYKNADEWNCDINRIAIIGFSAGGHLAAHYSNAFDCEEVRECFPESKQVNASILCYPVLCADESLRHFDCFTNLLGYRPNEEQAKKYSCEKLVNSNTPPAFIWHHAADKRVSVTDSLEYAKALSKFDIPFELRIYPFGRHGLSTVDDETNNEIEESATRAAEWIGAAISWLKMIFG